ncbi:MAG: hypothetical protein H6691_03510 [Gemmatimonadales bacterium]|nr:hypothetical protein [Gemmatimonadales bacterium]
MTVTVATGVCAPDVGEVTTLPITITQTGSSAPWGLSATGFDGLASNTLAGTLSATNQVTLSGSYPEDGGTTTAKPPAHADERHHPHRDGVLELERPGRDLPELAG